MYGRQGGVNISCIFQVIQGLIYLAMFPIECGPGQVQLGITRM
jgi:hypothetical protein